MRRKEDTSSSQNNQKLTCLSLGRDCFGSEEVNNFPCDEPEKPYTGIVDRKFASKSKTEGLESGLGRVPCGGSAAAGDPVLILDTSTPQSAQKLESIGRLFNRRNRRMWSRAIWALKLPGRYYFLTLTTTPESPALEKVWNSLRQWMKRYRPGICWLYCFTNEGKGQGVIHMVLRLGMKQKRLDANEVRAYWYGLTGARQVKIKAVPESKKEDLALYLANQKNKRGLAKEMGYQSAVTRWRYSKGWLPRGFGRVFGRAWVRVGDVPFGLKLKVLSDFLMRYYKDSETWVPGKMEKDDTEGWIFS